MVQFGFYVWAAAALAMVFVTLAYSGKGKKLLLPFAASMALWITYIVVLSRSGLLADFSLPPRVPLLIVIPAIAVCIIVTGRESFRDVLTHTPRYIPVYLQSFRIVVELLIYGAFVEGVFPERATFSGINFDIVAGTSAPVGAWLYQRKKISDRGLLAWNLAAMLILAVTVYAFISTYYFTDYATGSGSGDFTKMPYVLLASVLLPVAVFLHIFSLRQIRLVRRQGYAAPAKPRANRSEVVQ